MTKREAAVIEVYTGVVMLTGMDRRYLYEYASALIGRPIYTHELDDDKVAEELKRRAYGDFCEICSALT